VAAVKKYKVTFKGYEAETVDAGSQFHARHLAYNALKKKHKNVEAFCRLAVEVEVLK
jgi:hypothetical protein